MAPSAWRRQVLYLHQSAPRLPGTVRENLLRIERLTSAAVPPPATLPALPPLPPERDADRLSGGEAQLLALHRALLVDPRVLLLDESTSALDSPTARKVERALTEWVGRERGVLWVSHDDSLAARLGAREEGLVR